MNWISPHFLTLALSGLGYLLAGLLLKKYPPKKINLLYGYRTKNSMQNQERWDFAQKYAASELIKWGWILLVLSLPGLAIETHILLSLLTGLLILFFSVFTIIYQTERAIRKKFK